MKTVFETCEPRAEVLDGELRDEMFAARLKDVVEGTADAIYGSPRRFFENTYPTVGLQTLVHEVCGRLSGKKPTNSPFVRLETSFGGGKTHNLIALWHLSQGHADGLPDDFLNRTWLPSPKSPWSAVGLVGSDMDPGNGMDHGSVRTRTLWGELAWCLKGEAGYELVRKSDEALVGSAPLDKLIGDGPCLIMIDELARYLRAASAVATPNRASNLAAQTVAFLMSLIEYAASREKVCVVVTLADSTDAFAEETESVKQGLAHRDKATSESKSISARQERVITPTGDVEISKIVTHRLFREIDANAAIVTARTYADYFAELERKNSDLPPRAGRADYVDEIQRDYPFHPEFLATLTHKTSTIPNFQKTRGALRLLAQVVRRLWERKPEDAWLIATHHLDLGLEEIATDLTSRLERPQFRSVIEADIVSPKKGFEAHCQAIDRKWIEAGKPSYAQRVATSVFLHSLSQGIATGVDPAELKLGVLQPGDDSNAIEKSLEWMLGEGKGEPGTACWFFHWDGHRYRFKTEPSPEKIIQEELALVGKTKAKGELDERIHKIWKKGAFEPEFFPAEAGELDDDAGSPKLAIIHYDAASVTATAKRPPDLVLKLFNHAGSMEGFRTFKNNVLFLVADTDQIDRMVDVAQRHLAIRRIAADADRMSEFTDDQRKRIKAMQDASELDVRIAITRAYRWLYYPSMDSPKDSEGLAREMLPAQDQGDVEKDQSLIVLKVLRQLEKVITADDNTMPAAYVKAKAWASSAVSITTEDLRKEFAKRIGLKLLLDPHQLKKTIRAGVAGGTWVYFDTAEQCGYGKESPQALVEISDDAVLYAIDEARRLGLRVKGVEAPLEECPLCHKRPCECEVEEPDDGKQERFQIRVEGAPAQAFQRIADAASDAKAGRIVRILVHCEGAGKEAAADARGLGLAIPQLGKGSFHIVQTLNAEFGEPPGSDTFSLSFSGTWDRFKRVKELADAFAKEATKMHLKMTVRAEFSDGLSVEEDQFQQMRDIFGSLGIGKLVVEAFAGDTKKESN